MSSSCVPAKGPCVTHDPNPGSTDNDRDTDSECGSLCTCTSSSMTSIATSVATCNHPNGRVSRLGGSSVSLSQPLSQHQHHHHQQQQHNGSMGTTLTSSEGTGQAGDPSGNPYIVVFVPPAMLPGQNSNCGNCQGQGALQTAFRAYFVTACEFCPWVAGFVFIYYAFYWWGIGPGFSAFLFMMGSHALIRFIRARGDAPCGIAKLSRVPQNNPSNETDENEEEEEEEDADRGNEEEGNADAPPDVVNESPPSYEVAVVKPPPYDLYYHLTPTQPRSQTQLHNSKRNHNDNFLTMPDLQQQVKRAPSEADDDEDVFLPSYQDAIRLSFRSEKSIDDIDDNNDEDNDHVDVFPSEDSEES